MLEIWPVTLIGAMHTHPHTHRETATTTATATPTPRAAQEMSTLTWLTFSLTGILSVLAAVLLRPGRMIHFGAFRALFSQFFFFFLWWVRGEVKYWNCVLVHFYDGFQKYLYLMHIYKTCRLVANFVAFPFPISICISYWPHPQSVPQKNPVTVSLHLFLWR